MTARRTARSATQDRPTRSEGATRRWFRGVAALIAALVVGFGTACTGPMSLDDDMTLTPEASQEAAASPGSSQGAALGAPACQPPTPPPGSGTPSTAPRAGGGEADDNFAADFLKKIAGNAFDDSEGDGLGWLINSLTGGGNADAAELAKIEKEVTAIGGQITALQQQVYNVCAVLSAKLDELDKTEHRAQYNGAAQLLADHPLSALDAFQADYESLKAMLTKQQGTGKAIVLDGRNPDWADYADDVEDIRKNIIKDVIDPISDQMVSNQPGAAGMVEMYGEMLSENLGYTPVKTQDAPAGSHIYPAAYISAAYDQYDYYAGAIARAVNLYSEVVHMDFTTSTGVTYSAQPLLAQQAATAAQADIAAWGATIWGGEDSWVKHDLGRIPADSVADFRSKGAFRLWTIDSVAFPGDPGYAHQTDPQNNPTAREAPFYCGVPSSFCWANQYTKDGNLAVTTLTRPLTRDIAGMVDDLGHDGLAGWRVPTTTDWNALQQGAIGGLGVWGPANHLDMFTPEKVPSHVNGDDVTLSSIPPVIVNTATSSGPSYDLLGAPDPTVDDLQEQAGNSDAINAYAGRLFLVRDVSDTTNSLSAPDQAVSRTADQPERKKAPVSEPDPTTFTKPAVCSTASSYTVPDGVTAVRITAAGGDGVQGSENNQAHAPGGEGGTVSTTVPVTPGAKLYIQVGGAGYAGSGGIGGGGNSGGSVAVNRNNPSAAGGGGGASGVTSDAQCSRWLTVAGGGGGGGAGTYGDTGGTWETYGGRGGDGCTPMQASCISASAGMKSSGYPTSGGQPGVSEPGAAGGIGGILNDSTTKAGTGQNPSMLKGGNGGNANSAYFGGGGGGGGGGYYAGGGGGGAGLFGGGGGGGGGSSFVAFTGAPSTFGTASPGSNGSVTITPADPVDWPPDPKD